MTEWKSARGPPIRSGYLWIEDNLRKRDRLYQLANDTRKIPRGAIRFNLSLMHCNAHRAHRW
jgi:hypothetical protein